MAVINANETTQFDKNSAVNPLYFTIDFNPEYQLFNGNIQLSNMIQAM